MSPQYCEKQEEEEAGKLAIRLANGVVLPMVLKSAIELNLIETIFKATNDGFSLSPSQISSLLSINNPNGAVLLDRMLRLLASYDILNYSISTQSNGQVERLYSAKPICRFLADNQEQGSAAPLLLLKNHHVLMNSWCHLNSVILEGEGFPFNKVHGKTVYEYAVTDERLNSIFNKAMVNYSSLIMNKILNVYKGFDGIKVLVDVGGGTGKTLQMITPKYPQIKGINYDLPHVLAQAPSYPGIEHVAGDMSESVPKGDALFMKWILHNFRDEYCLKVLKNCWEALPEKGKLIVMDIILPEKPENKVSAQIEYEQDMVMLAQSPDGKERTKTEFEELAKKSGFSSCHVICSACDTWILEFHKTTT